MPKNHKIVRYIDEIPRFITKKCVKVYDQPGSADDRY